MSNQNCVLEPINVATNDGWISVTYDGHVTANDGNAATYDGNAIANDGYVTTNDGNVTTYDGWYARYDARNAINARYDAGYDAWYDARNDAGYGHVFFLKHNDYNDH